MYSVIGTLTDIPIGYTVIAALTGLPTGYSVTVGSHSRLQVAYSLLWLPAVYYGYL